MFCTSCGAKVTAGNRFCAVCGVAVGADADSTLIDSPSDDNLETLAPSAPGPSLRKPPSAPPPRRPSSSPSNSGTLTNSDPIGGGRFTPGQILAERYRIVALAGRGGMGEVYRAEDLKLSQVVAIKLLPQSLSQDAGALTRFHSEVRIARQVSHPNVCRVFDIGEVDGIAFLTMEYVDGEDLASVVRRIGRLSPDKAIEITRQICAGLAAAHDRGVVHRDLKPANVMLDGAGKIRITDFGLAGIAASIQGADVRAGTPAYMAPEQLAGKEVTIKSDLYSLGLIIYEILTGKRAFEAATLPELMKLRDAGSITNPSTLVRDLDPLVERVILRCLEKDPTLRPASALQVAAALPGGDPLAAALAAGETPSPEMVAASGSTEGMRPRLALSLLAIVIAGIAAYLFVADRTRLTNLTPMENPPEVLLARAHEIIKQLGFTTPPADSAYGFLTDTQYLSYTQTHDRSMDRWKAVASDQPAPMIFWYRQSPRNLESDDFFTYFGSFQVSISKPPRNLSGMILVMTDMSGRLIRFEWVPSQDEPPQQSMPPNWSQLLSLGGYDAAALHATESEWTPLAWGDSRAAWTGTVPGRPDIPMRLEAAGYRGKPVYFDVIHPWTRPERDTAYNPSTHEKFATITLILLFLGILIASILVMRRNMSQKRGDSRGAERLGGFVFYIFMGSWLLNAHHLGSTDEFNILILGMGCGYLVSTFSRMLYFSLEPFVRRRDPHTLISWSRLLAGQLRDPLVGRDFLIGSVYGLLLSLYESFQNLILPWLGKLPPPPIAPAPSPLLGVRYAIGAVLQYTWVFVLYSLLIFFLLFLIRLAVRKDWIALIVIVFLGAITNTGGDYAIATFIFGALTWVSICLVLRRFGLLTLVIGLVTQNILYVFPLTTHLSRWYVPSALAGLFAILGLSLYGFRAALAGQSLFSAEVLER
jgi:Protein kinase domain